MPLLSGPIDPRGVTLLITALQAAAKRKKQGYTEFPIEPLFIRYSRLCGI